MFFSFIILGIVTIIELFVCHFHLWWILALIARLLFSLRCIGATFKVKRLIIVEGVACACMLLWNMLFAKSHMPWLRILLFVAAAIICCITMVIDDMYYAYDVRDVEDD